MTKGLLLHSSLDPGYHVWLSRKNIKHIKKAKKTHFEDTEQASEPNSDMAGILEL